VKNKMTIKTHGALKDIYYLDRAYFPLKEELLIKLNARDYNGVSLDTKAEILTDILYWLKPTYRQIIKSIHKPLARRSLTTTKMPDGVIRAYRKAIRARDTMPISDDATLTSQQYTIGVMWELEQLYPKLKKLPLELSECEKTK
jgi:hypothetical protein